MLFGHFGVEFGWLYDLACYDHNRQYIVRSCVLLGVCVSLWCQAEDVKTDILSLSLLLISFLIMSIPVVPRFDFEIWFPAKNKINSKKLVSTRTT